MRDDGGRGRKIIPFRGRPPQEPPRCPFRLTTQVLAGLLVSPRDRLLRLVDRHV